MRPSETGIITSDEFLGALPGSTTQLIPAGQSGDPGVKLTVPREHIFVCSQSTGPLDGGGRSRVEDRIIVAAQQGVVVTE